MHSDEVQQQFATRVPIYDQRSAWIMDSGLLSMFVKAARAPQDAEMLDVCCGTGAVSGAFEGRVRRRVGVDLTAAMLEKARARMEECVRASALELPFPDQSFDLAVLRQALHFFDEPEKVVAEMYRVLRPGGQILLGQRVPYGPADSAWMAELNRLKQPLMRTFILDSTLRGALEAAGFGRVTWEDYQLWESIQNWVSSPETPLENRQSILEQVRQAPEAVRAVHPIEVGEGDVRAYWRWVVFSGFRPGEWQYNDQRHHRDSSESP